MLLIIAKRPSRNIMESLLQGALQVLIWIILTIALVMVIIRHISFTGSEIGQHFRLLVENGLFLAICVVCAVLSTLVYAGVFIRARQWRASKDTRPTRPHGAGVCELTGDGATGDHICKSCSCVCSPSMFFDSYFFLVSSSSTTQTGNVMITTTTTTATYATQFNRCPLCCIKAFCFYSVVIGIPLLLIAAGLYIASCAVYISELGSVDSDDPPDNMLFWSLATCFLDISAFGTLLLATMPVYSAPVACYLCIKALVFKLSGHTDRKLTQTLEQVQFSGQYAQLDDESIAGLPYYEMPETGHPQTQKPIYDSGQYPSNEQLQPQPQPQPQPMKDGKYPSITPQQPHYVDQQLGAENYQPSHTASQPPNQ